MARYIDADKMIDGYCTTFPYNLEYCDEGDLIEWLNAQPTADVAPRAEVAREIFAEIERTLNRKIRRIEPEYERLDECFEKLSECGHSQHGYCKGIISTCEDLQDLIDELKKKYLEGQK